MADSNIRNSTSAVPPILSGATSVAYNLPTSLTAGDPLRIGVSSNFGTTVGVVTLPANWEFETVQTTMGTGSMFVIERTGGNGGDGHKGWQTGDGSSVTITLSGVTSAIAHAYASVALNQSNASDWGTDGTLTVKGSSTTTQTAVADGGTSSQDHVVFFFGKMSSQNGTPTVAPNATVITSQQPTGSGTAAIWVGSYTGVTPATQTITYSVTSANGAGYQNPLTAAGSGSSSAVGMTTTTSMGVSGTVTQSGSPAMVTATTMGVTGTVTQSSAVAMTTATSLGVAGTDTQTAAPAMVTSTTMGVQGSGQVSSTVAMTTATTMGVAAASVSSSSVAMVTATTMGVTGTVTQSHAVAMSTATVMGVSGTAGIPTCFVREGTSDSDKLRFTTITTFVSRVRIKVSTSSSMTSPTFSSYATPDAQGYCTNITVTGLSANTYYWYQEELDGVLGSVKTAKRTLQTAGVATSASWSTGSCIQTLGVFAASVNPLVFNAIANRPSITGAVGGEFGYMLGDMGYPNNSASPGGDYITDTVANLRSIYENGMAQSHFATWASTTQFRHTFSDNDSGGGNCDAGSGAWPALTNGTTVTAWKQLMPYAPLPDSNALYGSWQDGRTLHIVLDDRTYSSGATVTDNSSKTKLGATQLAWLLSLITVSNLVAAKVAGVSLIVEDEWRDTGGTSSSSDAGLPAQNDGWGAYGTERTTIGNALALVQAAGIGVCMFMGDTHTLRVDSGANNPHGGFPTVTCAPYLQTAAIYTTGGITSDHGGWPTTDNVANQSYYSWSDQTDDGTTWQLVVKCWDSTGSSGDYTLDVQRGSTLTIQATGGATASPAMVTTTTLGVTGHDVVSSTVGMVTSTSMGVQAAGIATGAAAMVTSTTLGVTGTQSQSHAVALPVTTVMSVSGAVAATGAVGMQTATVLSVAARTVVFSTVGMVTTTRLGVNTQPLRDITVTVSSGPPGWSVITSGSRWSVTT